jgi:hypothetical protein
MPFGTFYSHLEHFTAIWYILWPFGNAVVIWYFFPILVIIVPEKSGNHGPQRLICRMA